MALDIFKSIDIIEIMENYIEKVRPEPSIRNQLDIDYEIDNNAVILIEVRPSYKNPGEIARFGYAKATYIKAKDIWKIFWKRADNKWHGYPPHPAVKHLKDFLELVDKDEYHCFKG